MKRHMVKVTLPGENEEKELFLIEISALTSKFKDFEQTYPHATPLHIILAIKIFGSDESQSVYGVLFDENMLAVFAFNRFFADYDKKEKKIVYKSMDDILLEQIDPIDLKPSKKKLFHSKKPPKEEPDFGYNPGSPFGFGGSSGAIRYSLIEKED